MWAGGGACVLAASERSWPPQESQGNDKGHIARSQRSPGVLKGGGKDVNRHGFGGRDRNNPVTRVLGAVAGRAGGAGGSADASTARAAAALPRPLPPNVVVSHIKEGVEIIHMYTGRPLCRLGLAPGVTHADINGDGVLDHIRVRGGSPNTGFLPRGKSAASHHRMQNCFVSVVSGFNVKESLFNGKADRFWNRPRCDRGRHEQPGLADMMPPLQDPSAVSAWASQPTLTACSADGTPGYGGGASRANPPWRWRRRCLCRCCRLWAPCLARWSGSGARSGCPSSSTAGVSGAVQGRGSKRGPRCWIWRGCGWAPNRRSALALDRRRADGVRASW